MNPNNGQRQRRCGAYSSPHAEDLELRQIGSAKFNDGQRTSCRRTCNFTTFNGKNLEQVPGPVRAEPKQEIHQVDCGGQISTIAPLNSLRLQVDKNLRPIELTNGDNRRETAGDTRPREPFRFAGYLSTILAALCNSISLLFVKLLPVEDNLQEKAKTAIFRGLSIMLFCGISIVHQGYSFKVQKGEYWLNFLRTLSGSCSLISTYISLMYITLGESQTMINWSCVWTCLLSFVIFHEPLAVSLFVSVPMSFLGIILLAKPDLILDITSELPARHADLHQVAELVANVTVSLEDDLDHDFFVNRWPGFVAATAASVTWTTTTIILKLRKTTPIVTCSFYHGLGQIVLGLGIQLAVGFASPPSSVLECALHAGVGFFAFLTQNLFQWGLLFVPAGTYSVVRTLEIPFSFLLGAIFLGELVLWTSVAGSALIVVAISLLVFNDQLVRGLGSLCWRAAD